MPDSDKKLQIEIAINKSGDGDQQAVLSLEQLQARARELKPSLENVKDAHDSAARAAEKHGEKIEGLNELFEALGRETMPEVAHALQGLGMGGLGYVTAALAIVNVVRELIERFDEQKKKLAEQAEGFAESHGKLMELKAGYGEYLEQLNHVVSTEEKYVTTLKNQAEQRRAIAEIEARTRHAAEGAEIAETETDFAAARITAPQRAARVADAQSRAEIMEHQASEKAAQDEIDALKKERADRESKAPELAAAVDEAQKKFETDTHLKTEAPKTMAALRKKIEEAEKQSQLADDYLKRGTFPRNDGEVTADVPLTREERAQLEADKAEAEARLNSPEGLRHQLGVQTKINETPVSEAALNEAKNANNENKKAIETLPVQIANVQKLADEAEKGNITQEQSDDRKRLAELITRNRGANLGGGVTLGFLSDVEHARSEEAGYAKLTADERARLSPQQQQLHQENQRIIEAFRNLMTSQSNHNVELYHWIQTFMSHAEKQGAQIQDIRRQIDFLSGRN